MFWLGFVVGAYCVGGIVMGAYVTFFRHAIRASE